MTFLEATYLEAPAFVSGLELRQAFLGLQEGVFESGDLKVTAGGGTREVIVAAGRAMICGDAVTDQGLYGARNDANVSSNSSAAGDFEAGGIPVAHATLPRIDQIVARVYDHPHDGSGQTKGRPEVIAGTATSGATLDNRTGAVTLPAGAVRLADVLVPAAATTISAGNIRDRRPWARGAHLVINRGANAGGGASYSVSSTTYTDVDATNLAPRVELSGVPVRISFLGFFEATDGAGRVRAVDNNTAVQEVFVGGDYAGVPVFQWGAPTAGSHIIKPQWRSTTTTLFWYAETAQNRFATMLVEEIVRQNANNG